MPGFDRTGPEGKGSQTGRKMGKCNPANKSSEETEFGRGQGRRKIQGEGNGRKNGSGKGRGLGRRS